MKLNFFFWFFVIALFFLSFAEYYYSENYQENASQGIHEVEKWTIQLQNADPELISLSGFDMVVIDYSKDGDEKTKYKKEEIEKIESAEKIPIAYLSIGEAENYRFYWQEKWKTNSPDWLGRENVNWEGNYKVKYWDKRWKNIVFSYVDKIIEQGFSGVYLDIVDGFEYWSDSKNEESVSISKEKAAREMIVFVEEIARYAKNKKENGEFYVIPQNAENILAYDTDGSYLKTISGMGVESLFYEGTNLISPEKRERRINYLNRITGAGKLVFVVDYIDNGSGYFGENKDTIDDFREKSASRGYISYVAREDKELDELNVLSEFQGKGTRKKILSPENGCYLGMFPGWGEREDSVNRNQLKDFEKLSGRGVVISPFSSFFGEKNVSEKNLYEILEYGAIPLLRLMPWEEPYWEPKYQPKYSLDKIIEGDFDSFLIEWADKIKAFNNPVMVAFGVEMNGNWFPWSGKFQGGSVKNKFRDKKKEDGPEKYIVAYRHIVKIFERKGVNNVTWLFHVNGESYPDQEWNSIKAYYPGDKYVDWVGVSVYGSQYKNEKWRSFKNLMDPVYEELTRNFPQKPLMLAEWGVGEYPRKGNKASWYKKALDGIQNKYKLFKMVIIYSGRWENDDGSFSDLRINSSEKALRAYKRGISSDYFIDKIEQGEE